MTTTRPDPVYWSAEEYARAGLRPRPAEERRRIAGTLLPLLQEWYRADAFPPLDLVLAYSGALRLRGTIGEGFGAVLTAAVMRDRGGWSFRSAVERVCLAAEDPTERPRIEARGLHLLTRDLELPGTLRGRVGELYRLLRDPKALAEALAVPLRRAVPKLAAGDLQALRDRLDLLSQDDVVKALSQSLGAARRDNTTRVLRRRQAVQVLRGNLERKLEDPPVQDREGLLRVLAASDSGEYLRAAFLRLLPVFRVRPPAGGSQAFPVGGYADLSNRGPFDRLLISELAYPEEEFVRRFAEGEQLYYDLEAPPRRTPPVQLVLLDDAPTTWGIARLAGQAAALSLLERAWETGAAVRIFSPGAVPVEFEGLDGHAGLARLLEHQRWEEGLADALASLFARGEELGADAASGVDLIVCTEEGKAAAAESAARACAAARGTRADEVSVRVHLFSVDALTGSARLATLREIGRDEVFRVDLHPRAVAPPPAAPAGGPAGVRFGRFPVRPECQWGHWSPVTCASLDAQGRALTGHRNGDVHLWDAMNGTRVARIARLGEPVNAVCIGQRHVLISSTRGMRSFSLQDGELRPIGESVGAVSAWKLRRGRRPDEFVWQDARAQFHSWCGDRESGGDAHRAWRSASEPAVASSADMWRLGFLVDRGADRLVYCKSEGMRSRPWGEGSYEDRGVASSEAAGKFVERLGTVFDEEGRVFLLGSKRGLEVRTWTGTPWTQATTGKGADWSHPSGALLETKMIPLAVNGACQRAVCANGETLWFWDLRDGSMVARRPPGKALPTPTPVPPISEGARGRGIDFQVKSRLRVRLTWKDQVRLEALSMTAASAPPPEARRPVVDSLYQRVTAGTSGAQATWMDLLLLTSRQGHDHEFWVPGESSPVAWFHFNGTDRWAVVATDGLAAGTRLGLAAVHLPAGLVLRPDPEALAKRLRDWQESGTFAHIAGASSGEKRVSRG
ncbi:MAG: hypothetical protein HYZ53_20275 [Planctomycetes bacterium]|nr:hypothetical protein [Planctomycetota bacterium]